MDKNYELRETIWKKFYSYEAIEKLENYTINLLNQGKTESEINLVNAQYKNEYWNELKKIGLFPEDQCILYGEYDVNVFDEDLDKEFALSYTFIDYEYFMENDIMITFPLDKKTVGMLINDLLKYNQPAKSITKLKIKYADYQKSYIIKEFNDHIHLSTKDVSDFIPIPTFSTKITHIIKELLTIYNKF